MASLPVYRALELPGENPHRDAHAAAVVDACGIDGAADLLARLVAPNQHQQVAARLDAGRPVGGSDVPQAYPRPGRME